MNISFSPVAHHAPISVSVAGDTITIDGEAFDFGDLPEGASLPVAAIASYWFCDGTSVDRNNGEIHLTLKLPFGPNAPVETRFPQPVTVGDGPVPLPAYEIEAEDDPVEAEA